MLIGQFMVSLSAFKSTLLAKHARTADLLLELIAGRGRAHCEEISKAFSEMHDMLQEQPKDIEKLTEIQEFLAGMQTRTSELQSQIEEMTEHYDALESLCFEARATERDVIMSSRPHVIMSSRHHVLTASRHHVITSSRHHVITSSRHHIISRRDAQVV